MSKAGKRRRKSLSVHVVQGPLHDPWVPEYKVDISVVFSRKKSKESFFLSLLIGSTILVPLTSESANYQ
jgi:hypothetical protein